MSQTISCSAELELQSQAAAKRGSCKVRKKVKRKSRAVVKPPTRLLLADKSNFKDLVYFNTSNVPHPPPPPPPPSHTHITPPSYFSPQAASSSSSAKDNLLKSINPLVLSVAALISQHHGHPFGTPASPRAASPSSSHPIPSSALGNDHTLTSSNTNPVEAADLPDMEHMQNSRQAAMELDSFLRKKDDEQDDLVKSKILCTMNTWLSCDEQKRFLELVGKCL